MPDAQRFPLRIVDGLRLDKPLRDALMPGRIVLDDAGRERSLPRFFYEVQTWTQATEVRLSPGFALAEFIQTDVREAAPLRGFPRYVPCAITITALCLERFREVAGTFVHIAANGGYRSPRHAVSSSASPHAWGTAVNIYRIGDVYLDTRDAVERYAAVARQELPGVWTRPFGTHRGQTTDHLHLDFGYIISTPREAPERHLELDVDRRAS